MIQLRAEGTRAALIRSRQHPYMPLVNLQSQHCAALSGFADIGVLPHGHVGPTFGVQGCQVPDTWFMATADAVVQNMPSGDGKLLLS